MNRLFFPSDFSGPHRTGFIRCESRTSRLIRRLEVHFLQILPSQVKRNWQDKEDFLRWKAEREAEGMEFYNRLSEVMDTEDDLAVGDIVAFTNDYGVVFGPQEVLAFRKPWNGDRCVYLDSDAYWFPDRPDQLTLLSKKGAE